MKYLALIEIETTAEAEQLSQELKTLFEEAAYYKTTLKEIRNISGNIWEV